MPKQEVKKPQKVEERQEVEVILPNASSQVLGLAPSMGMAQSLQSQASSTGIGIANQLALQQQNYTASQTQMVQGLMQTMTPSVKKRSKRFQRILQLGKKIKVEEK